MSSAKGLVRGLRTKDRVNWEEATGGGKETEWRETRVIYPGPGEGGKGESTSTRGDIRKVRAGKERKGG